MSNQANANANANAKRRVKELEFGRVPANFRGYQGQVYFEAEHRFAIQAAELGHVLSIPAICRGCGNRKPLNGFAPIFEGPLLINPNLPAQPPAKDRRKNGKNYQFILLCWSCYDTWDDGGYIAG